MADMDEETFVLTALGACPECGCYENRPVYQLPQPLDDASQEAWLKEQEHKGFLACHCDHTWVIDLNTCTAPENPFRQQIIVHEPDCTDVQREDGNA